MHITFQGEMRKASQADWRELAAITADAFSDDPVLTWMLGTQRAKLSVFRTLAREVYLPRGLCQLIPGKGATMWGPADTNTSPGSLQLMMFAVGQILYGSKGALQRGMRAADAMQAYHPNDRHWYLFTIGTTRQARGTGLGKALLRPVLEACDRDRMPVYLENSNPVNSGFYRAHGFERMADPFELGPGSPPMEPMWREPAPVAYPG